MCFISDSTTDNPTYAEIGGNGGMFVTLPAVVSSPSKTEQVRIKHSRLGSATLPLICNEGFTDYPRDEFSPTLPPPRQTYQELDMQQMAQEKSRTFSDSSRIYQIDDNMGYMIPNSRPCTMPRNHVNEYLELIPEDGCSQTTLPYDQKGGIVSPPPQVQSSNGVVGDHTYIPLIVDKPESRTGYDYVDVDYKSRECGRESTGNHSSRIPPCNGVNSEGRKIPSAPAVDGSFYFTLEGQEACRVNTVPTDPECQDYFVLERDNLPENQTNQNQNNQNEQNDAMMPADSDSRDYFVLEKENFPEKSQNGDTEHPGVNGSIAKRPLELNVLINRTDSKSNRSYCRMNSDDPKMCSISEISGYQQLPLLSPSKEDTEVYSKLNRGFMKNTKL